NCGMNRLGFKPHHYVQAWARFNNLANVAKITQMMHFSDADGERFGQQGIDYQITDFEEIVKDLPGERSVSNCAAILRYQDQLTSDYVRSGIMLYC
ncbi:alanine racemase, partial [Acinetobacter baumannii]|uniref:alanine racemase n=1 Tax=Acinetobacter baumannii TaxID=470 RepID=UPI003AF92B87